MKSVFDEGRAIDWGATSGDYADFRPGPPDGLYSRLQALGIGVPGQRILDLGTGTGVVARALARQGAIVSGTDISAHQIDAARKLSAAEGLDIEFRVAAAEEPPFAARSFDIATANQCFLYFDKPRAVAALRKVLVPGGRLMTSHFNWLPKVDAIAAASEALVLEFNPAWQAAGFDGRTEPIPQWMPPDWLLEAFFWFDVDVPFDHASWRGRVRASRCWCLSFPDDVARFDAEHAKLLERIAPANFTIRHRIDARILRLP